MKLNPSDLSPAMKRLNPHLFINTTTNAPQPAPATPAKRIRQSGQELNKLETRFLNEYLLPYHQADRIKAQSLRFRLGNGIWYKPDFTLAEPGERLICYEVKGPFAYRGGMENLKVAASQYQWIDWFLAWNDLEWKIQHVLP
jgi:hypothetical protein